MHTTDRKYNTTIDPKKHLADSGDSHRISPQRSRRQGPRREPQTRRRTQFKHLASKLLRQRLPPVPQQRGNCKRSLKPASHRHRPARSNRPPGDGNKGYQRDQHTARRSPDVRTLPTPINRRAGNPQLHARGNRREAHVPAQR